MVRIMLNTNVFCRPFDSLEASRIIEEAKSSEIIFSLAWQGKLDIISSDVLYSEVDLIDDKTKNESVYYLIKTVEKERILMNEGVLSLADALNSIINDYNDCLHIAFAAIGKCHCLITCDYELINKRRKIETFLLSKGINLKIKTPTEFIGNYN